MLLEEIDSCCTEMSMMHQKKMASKENEEVTKNNDCFFAYWAKLKQQTYSLLLATHSFEFVPDQSTNDLILQIYSIADTAFQYSIIGKDKLAEFVRGIDKLSTTLASVWQTHIYNTDDYLTSKIRVLSIIDKYKTSCTFFLNLRSLIQQWPLNKSTIDNYLTCKAKAEELIKNIKLESEIETFLNKVALSKATIQDLTPTVLKWINESHLDQSFNILVSN